MKAVPVLVGVTVTGLLTWTLLGATSQVEEQVIGEYVTSLQGRTPNQRHNALLAVKRLDGIRVAPGETFSFNQEAGPWSRDRGFRRAPVSFGGNLVDQWGGGVCQTSSTLYNAAMLAGMGFVERHPHHHAPDYIAPGRDAAVAYPNIDLKFQNTSQIAVTISAKITGNTLKIGLVSRQTRPSSVRIVQRVLNQRDPMTITVSGERRLRNPGKRGHEVETFRVMGDRKERLSRDSYPVMHRVEQR